MSAVVPAVDRVRAPVRLSAIGVVLGGGLALRLVLAFVLFPGRGLASDLGLFESWAITLAQVGPGSFYETARTANYPPGYMYVLWAVGLAGQAISGLAGVPLERVVVLLVKLPVILADLGVAFLLYRAGRRWFGERRGVLAAALYLFIPVTWYDSAIWGQVDAAVALVMIAAVVLLIEGWSEPAAALAVISVLVKPQGLIVLVVVAPVLLRRHLIRVGSGPIPALGPRATSINRRLDGWLTHQGPWRLVSAAVVAVLAGIAVLLPFDLARAAPASLADLPVIGQIAGLVSLIGADAGQYSVLTANAFNAWALVGPRPLVEAFAAGSTSWTPDSLVVFGGLTAAAVGAILLAGTGLLVALGLLLGDGRLRIVLALTVIGFAFYALPTRVHERYLFPVFASGALLVAGIAPAAWYVATGLLNALNLHAVLTLGGGGGGPAGGGRPGFGGGSGPGGGGFPGAGQAGGFGGGASAVQLPFGNLSHADVVVAAAAVGQTFLFVALLAAWVAVMIRPGLLQDASRG